VSDFPIRLLGGNIAVQFEPTSEAFGLIVMPERGRDKDPSWAKVIAKGPGIRTKKDVLIPIGVEVGDRVLVAPQHKALKQSWILSEAIIGRTDIVIIEEEDIFVVDDG